MLVCALLEDVAVLDNLDAIISVPGIDSCSISPNDFAQSLGYPGQPDHPEVVKAMQEITRRIACGLGAGAPSSLIRRAVGSSARDGQPRYVEFVHASGVAAGDLGPFVVRHALQDLRQDLA